MNPRKRVAVLVSGRGSNLLALLDAQRCGALPSAEIALVLSNDPAAPALALAQAHGVHALAIDHRPYRGDRSAHEAAIVASLREHRINIVVMAGYTRIVTNVLLEAFAGCILNIHPSLLPSFKGLHGPAQALQAGTRVAGCTVHEVIAELDAGRILAQRAVPVLEGDTEESLAARILREEHALLPAALERFAAPTTARLPFDLLIATGNAGKLREYEALLAGSGARLRSLRDYPLSPEPEENGATYEANALLKARHGLAASNGTWTLCDDSGLEVDALGGAPGLHSARYAPTAGERIAKLLSALAHVPPERRAARFVCVCALAGPNGEEFTARGVLKGTIALAPRGEGGFGYDPIFIPNGFGGVHLAELPARLKDRISHRGQALAALMPILYRAME